MGIGIVNGVECTIEDNDPTELGGLMPRDPQAMIDCREVIARITDAPLCQLRHDGGGHRRRYRPAFGAIRQSAE